MHISYIPTSKKKIIYVCFWLYQWAYYKENYVCIFVNDKTKDLTSVLKLLHSQVIATFSIFKNIFVIPKLTHKIFHIQVNILEEKQQNVKSVYELWKIFIKENCTSCHGNCSNSRLSGYTIILFLKSPKIQDMKPHSNYQFCYTM